MSTIISTSGTISVIDGNTSTSYPNISSLNISGSGSIITNPSPGTIAISITGGAGFVPYTGATGNVDLGTFNLTTPLIYGSTSASGTLTVSSTSNATKGTIQIGSTDIVNIGNKTTTSQRLVRIGQDTAWLDIGSLVGSTSAWAIYGNQATPSVGVAALWGGSTTTNLNGPATVNVTIQTAIGYTMNAFTENLFQQPLLRTSGTGIFMEIRPGANTNQSTTQNIPNFKITGANKQWATGTITNQYWNYLTANTASFVGASTMTNSYGLFVEAATAGTNATITNNYAAGFNGSIQIQAGSIPGQGIVLREQVGSTTYGAIYFGQTNPGAGNWAIRGVNNAVALNTPAGCELGFFQNGSNTAKTTTTGQWSFLPLASTTGATTGVTITVPSNTNQTATTNIPNFQITGNNKQWATGTVADQYFTYLTANTVSAVGASTFTNVYGLYVEAATAGTNATITNNYAAGFGGNIQLNTPNATVYFNATNGIMQSLANFRLKTGSGAEVFVDIGTTLAVMRVSNTRALFTGLNVVLSSTALATNATDGFTYIPTAAGVPTGVPTSFSGTVPMIYDTVGNKLYIYNGSWKSVGLL